MRNKEVHRARIIHSELDNSYSLHYKLHWFCFWTFDQKIKYDVKPGMYPIYHLDKEKALKRITERYEELLCRTIVKDSKNNWTYV